MVLSGAYSSILQTSIILLGILIFTLAKPTNAQSALNDTPDSSFVLLQERDTNYVHLLLASARQQNKASPDSALVFYEKALQESKKLSFPRGETISYAGMGKYFLDKSTFRAAKIYLSRADSIAQKHGYENIRLRNAVHLATTLLMLGEFDEAASVIQRNTVLAQKHKDWKSLGLLHKNRGMIYGRQSNFQKALEANLAAITYFEKADFLPGVAGMHNNVGHIYAETGQSQNAIKQFEKARLIFRSIEDKSGEVLCLNNIGNRYIEIEKIDSAIHYLYAANKLIKQLDRKLELLYNCLSISDALAKKGKLIEAEKFIQEANTLCEQMGKNDLLPYVYIPLATVREKQ
ncbi:MAG: tetratricopeptide repeat protein, partial [Bacteroidota bacterium]